MRIPLPNYIYILLYITYNYEVFPFEANPPHPPLVGLFTFTASVTPFQEEYRRLDLNTGNELKYNHPIAGDSRGLNQWRIEPTEKGCYKQHRTHSLGTAPMQNEHPPTEKYPHSYLWTRCSTHQQLWSNSWRCRTGIFFLPVGCFRNRASESDTQKWVQWYGYDLVMKRGVLGKSTSNSSLMFPAN